MTLTRAQLATLLHGFRRPRVLVVGDVMLDHYVFGRCERLSPEAPTPILRVEREENRPGGAGSVASMLRKLDADVAIVSAVGSDAEGQELRAALERLGCDVSGIVRVDGRPTTVKTRMIAAVQHLLRVDREVDHAYAGDVDAALLAHAARLLPECDLVLLSDYGKGLLKGGLVGKVAKLAREAKKDAILDPKKSPDWSAYKGVSAITPNRAETELATGLAPKDADAWRRAGMRLVDLLELDAVVMTLDKDGIFLQPKSGAGAHFPTEAQAVFDVTGAGDMVLSMIGLARACGAEWAAALELANFAAGLEITRVGVAPLSRHEIAAAILGHEVHHDKVTGLAELCAGPLAEARRQKKRVVFTNGVFDLLHIGHVKMLQFARAQGDVLIVGLNSDASTRGSKEEGRPIVGEQDRASVIAGLASVDHVVIFDEKTPLALIEAIVPDVLVKGKDYENKAVVGRAVVEAAGGRVVLAPLVDGKSTTALLKKGGVAVDEAASRAARAAADALYEATEALALRGGTPPAMPPGQKGGA